MKGATVMILIWMSLLMIIIIMFIWTCLKSNTKKKSYDDPNSVRWKQKRKNMFLKLFNQFSEEDSTAFPTFLHFMRQFTSHLRTSKQILQLWSFLLRKRDTVCRFIKLSDRQTTTPIPFFLTNPPNLQEQAPLVGSVPPVSRFQKEAPWLVTTPVLSVGRTLHAWSIRIE